MLADVLSTGVFILGPDDGMALIETTARRRGRDRVGDNQVLISSGLKGKVSILAPPTDIP